LLRFDAPLGRERRPAQPGLVFGDEAVRRLPFGDRRARHHAAAEVEREGPTDSPIELRRHEPRRDAGAGCDRLPDPFWGAFGFDLDAATPGRLFLHAHDQDSVGGMEPGPDWPSADLPSGWASTTTRCRRPPGAVASW